MKKISKSKKGFTLVEMVLVIAIIVILAAVMLIGVGKYITYSKTAASEMKSHNDATNSVAGDIAAVIGGGAASGT